MGDIATTLNVPRVIAAIWLIATVIATAMKAVQQSVSVQPAPMHG
jgi:hypothetical protein